MTSITSLTLKRLYPPKRQLGILILTLRGDIFLGFASYEELDTATGAGWRDLFISAITHGRGAIGRPSQAMPQRYILTRDLS